MGMGRTVKLLHHLVPCTGRDSSGTPPEIKLIGPEPAVRIPHVCVHYNDTHARARPVCVCVYYNGRDARLRTVAKSRKCHRVMLYITKLSRPR